MALILGFLLAYAWWLVLVGIILPAFALVIGPTRTSAHAEGVTGHQRSPGAPAAAYRTGDHAATASRPITAPS